MVLKKLSKMSFHHFVPLLNEKFVQSNPILVYLVWVVAQVRCLKVGTSKSIFFGRSGFLAAIWIPFSEFQNFIKTILKFLMKEGFEIGSE